MGTVWLARMTGKLGFERMVALKTILPTYSSDRQFGDMFLDEAKIAARIDHENVARILEIGEDAGILYYAMELIDGESLRKLYRDVRAANMHFPMGVALRVVADACAGLHATHDLTGDDGHPLEVVHRDVSPQNLLITIRGTTKLIDFGVAKANARRSEETAAGTLKGKIEYMAPEQAAGEPLDRRADVYALGAVLYELLAGKPVRDTDQGKQLAALHDLMTGVPYTPLPSTIPQLVRGIVDRALARDPSLRFTSAEELRRALEQAMLATGQGATTDDVANVLGHFSRERTAKRKDAIERAVRAVTDGRLNAATIVAPLPSSRAMPVPQQGTMPGTIPGGSPHGSAPYGSAPGGPGGSAPGAYGPGGSGPPSYNAAAAPPWIPMPHHAPLVASDGPPTGPSMRTIGPASLSSPPAARSSAAKIVAGVFVLGLVAVLGVVAGVLFTRSGQRATARGSESASGTTASAALTAVPIAETGSPIDPVPPVIDPAVGGATTTAATPTTPASASARAGKDAGAGTTGAGRRPTGPRPTGKPGAKPGDGDEYGF